MCLWHLALCVNVALCLISVVFQSNRSISKLGFSDVGLGDKGLVLVGKLLQVSKNKALIFM